MHLDAPATDTPALQSRCSGHSCSLLLSGLHGCFNGCVAAASVAAATVGGLIRLLHAAGTWCATPYVTKSALIEPYCIVSLHALRADAVTDLASALELVQLLSPCLTQTVSCVTATAGRHLSAAWRWRCGVMAEAAFASRENDAHTTSKGSSSSVSSGKPSAMTSCRSSATLALLLLLLASAAMKHGSCVSWLQQWSGCLATPCSCTTMIPGNGTILDVQLHHNTFGATSHHAAHQTHFL